ncbi:hypothetical protein VP01_2505g2 [Puccinia sorghi]|uniref:N-alpha-acetyltransferase 60 n=1 Tax=Puccinia sorghi TaxID=27349 RepID=A0A0L6V5M8_9BASI|nr:hypothetical protein VP01_2505g2 [Puccinia sorghi]
MPLGCWLPLVPATEQQQPTPPPAQQHTTDQPPTATTTTSIINTPFPFKKASKQQQHTHDHHPSPNSFLKPMVLECQSRRPKKSKLSTKPKPLPLTENSSIISAFSKTPSASSSFEIRPLQVCDIEKVRELHCASLPVTYPSSFFYNLLAGNPNEQISLVATLPSTGLQGYLEVLNSLGQPPSQPVLANHHCHLGHHHYHHVTSPLSGRKPISLDVVGTITARLLGSDPSPSGPAVRILTLCVSPDYRRFGVGRLLLDSMLKQIKARFSRRSVLHPSHQSARKIAVNLHVQATNTVAHAFYQSAGFFRIAFKPGYYSNDDLKPLDPALKLASSTPPPPKPFSQFLMSPDDLPASQDPSHSQPSDIDAWFLELALDYL